MPPRATKWEGVGMPPGKEGEKWGQGQKPAKLTLFCPKTQLSYVTAGGGNKSLHVA